MIKLQTSMNAYVKWLAHRDSLLGEKGVPTAVLARTMIAHGEDFDPDSQFGNCLIEMGRANDQVAQLQEQYNADATSYWLDSVERSVAMMKEYQVSHMHKLHLCYNKATFVLIFCHRTPAGSWNRAVSLWMPPQQKCKRPSVMTSG